MAEVTTASRDRIEILCKAYITTAATVDLEGNFGVDIRDELLTAIFEEVLGQAAPQVQRKTGMAMEAVHKAIFKVRLDGLAERFMQMVAERDAKPPE